MFGFMNMNMTMFHGFSMFIFWIIFIYLIFAITKKKSNDSALDIVKKRFANGEITKEQFNLMKATLIGNED